MNEFQTIRSARPDPSPPSAEVAQRSRQLLDAAIADEVGQAIRRRPRWLKVAPTALALAGFVAVLGVLVVKLGGANEPSTPAVDPTVTEPKTGLEPPFSVSPDGVAGAQVGMTEAQVEQAWQVPLELDGIDDTCQMATVTARGVWLVPVFAQGRLASVWVRAGARTDKGLAIGDREERIAELYPSGIRRQQVRLGEHPSYFASGGTKELRFDLDATDTVAAIAYGDDGALNGEFACLPPVSKDDLNVPEISVLAKTSAPLTNFTLDGVAGVRIGMSEQEVEGIWDTDLQLYGAQGGPLGICDTVGVASGAARISLEFRDAKLSVIATNWPAGDIATDAGIGIGSTRAELEAAYPNDLTSEANKYYSSARDFYYRRPSDTEAAGYRFLVSAEGKVVEFSYGNEAIAALEGCS